jgi:hypothetical protein
MDDYMFQTYVAECKCVREETSYLEIFNYSVSWLPPLLEDIRAITDGRTF